MCEYILGVSIILACSLFFFRYRKRNFFRWTRDERSEIICEKIIRAIPDMVFIFDHSLRILKLYNPNEKELIVPASELIGENVRDHLNGRFADLIEASIKKTIESDGVYEMEYEVQGEQGKEYYEGRFLCIRKNEFACFVRNITSRKRNEILMKQNQELLNSILDNIPFPVMLKDMDDHFRYIYWNKECDRQSGFNRNQILGKTDIDIYGKERGGNYQKIDRQVLDEGKPYQNQELFVTPDGVEHSSIVYKNLIITEAHRWLLVTRWDTTELALAEKSLKKANHINQLVLNNTNIGFVFINPDYVIQWENISSYTRHPVICRYRTGTKCYENVWGIGSPCSDCVMQKAIASGNTEQKIVAFEDKTVFEIMANPVFDEQKKLLGVVVRIEDVTIKKQIAQELQRAKEDAEKSDRLKSAFLANMSHEIRTPLNAILGFSELLYRTEDDSERAVYVDIIKSNNDLLLQLINDILDLSKIEANTLEFIYSDIDVNGLLRELERSFRFKLADTPDLEINFIPGLPQCIIHTEKNRFLQVISNFITNAIKFTSAGEITFGYETCEEGLYFYVKDTGVGIPENKQKEIFDRFVKLDSFKTGTGLGLSICQTIVRKLNGKIGVRSEEGKGSEFWFILPCETLEKAIPADEEISLLETGVENKKEQPLEKSVKPVLLIAEDVIDNYRLFQVLLGNKYDLLHAWNGREAVEIFSRCHPDAILMDIKMPEMDGYQATSEIRKLNLTVPVIAVTAFAFAEDKKRILESGFTGYLTKPVTSESLAEALQGL